MKNLITIITVLVFAITVNAQTQTTNPFAQLESGFNFPQNGGTNQIAANYASTGVLPHGYTTKTAQQICQEQNAAKMWVKYDVAAEVNKEINGGHIAHPNEKFIITPQGNIHSAAKCGNHAVAIQFYKNPANPVNVAHQTVDIQPIANGQIQNRRLIEGNSQSLRRIETNQDAIVDNQITIDSKINTLLQNDATAFTMLQEIRDNTAASAKYARQARNWSIVSTGISGIAATASVIDLVNGDGNTTQIIRNIRNITNNTTNNTTTNPNTGNTGNNGGVGHNGNGAN